ncbi:hypothetical protein IKP94_04885 [Candidatus Saccharibacteria bacterium]|nr:hypothetical protein [Candidatus Saccharibacteria bacterium]
MATKAKKTTAKKPVAKKTTVKSKKTSLPVGVIYEKYPEDHQATGKYKFFYCLFALTTIIFAGLAVWLFIFSSEILNKYESIEACARTHGATCEIHVSGDAEQEAVKED